jgi:putative two-component system response regulator
MTGPTHVGPALPADATPLYVGPAPPAEAKTRPETAGTAGPTPRRAAGPASPTRDGAIADQIGAMRALFGTPRMAQQPVLEGPAGDQVISNPRIVIIDDEPINVKVVQKYLKLAGYQQFATTTDATTALDLIRAEQPDVVLLDVMMPGLSGLEILAELRRGEQFFDLPVIILTAAADRETKLNALGAGATEFLAKPVDAVELEVRLRNVLAAKAHRDRIKDHAWELEREVAIRTAELSQAHREVILCLAKVGEYRDNETGNHVLRVGRYAAVIARRLGMNAEFVARIQQAAALHDIGKVGIPDAVLLKPGKLDELEFERMQLHCSYGRNVCASASESGEDKFESHAAKGRAITAIGSSPILSMATVIAYTHHEKWEGNGYPSGLSGEQIPIEGRITAVADVFDALTSERPYNRAYSLEDSLAIMKAERGRHFDPLVLDALVASIDEIVRISCEYSDRP